MLFADGNIAVGGIGGDGGDGNGNSANGGDFNSGDFSGNGGFAFGDNGNGGAGGDAVGGEHWQLSLQQYDHQQQYSSCCTSTIAHISTAMLLCLCHCCLVLRTGSRFMF